MLINVVIAFCILKNKEKDVYLGIQPSFYNQWFLLPSQV